jgi:hypothetical protein
MGTVSTSSVCGRLGLAAVAAFGMTATVNAMGSDLSDSSRSPQGAALSDCTARLVAGADLKCKLSVGGRQREFLLYAPANYDASKPVALVVDAHGALETAENQAGLTPFRDWPGHLGSGFRLVADQHGFVVAQPQGLNNDWKSSSDVDFIMMIPKFVEGIAPVDPERVFLSGISDGGQLVYWVGCQDTGTFRAFAGVSAFNADTCALTRPAPMLHFHSPDDAIIGYDDGQAAFQDWVDASHCKVGPTNSLRFGGAGGDTRPYCLTATGNTWQLGACRATAPATTCQTSSQCDNDATSTFCTVAPDKVNHYLITGGHILYINGTGLSLAAVAWDFFSALK